MFKSDFKKTAFSLIELSVVVLIIGILIAGITAGSRLVRNSKLASAAQFTKSSDINSIPDLVLWLEPTQENSFATTSTNSGNLTYANVASLQDANYIKDTLRPDNREYVARWNDINPRAVPGNKKSVYQEVAAQRPMYIANAINGLPALQFDGTESFLYSLNNNITPASPPLLEGDDSYTMIAVFSPNAVRFQAIIHQDVGSGDVFYRAASIMTADSIFVMDGTMRNIILNTQQPVVQQRYIVAVTLEDSNVLATNNGSLYVNTSPLQPNNSFFIKTPIDTSDYNIGNGMFSLGIRARDNAKTNSPTGGGSKFSGLIGEVMVFDRALKNEELDTIMKYLSKKWGIALK